MSTRPDRLVLAVGASGDAGAVFAALSEAYTVHAEPATTMHWTWLDTADWRLHRAGISLREERHGKQRQLVVDRFDREPLAAPVTAIRWPARLDGLAPSSVRDAIAPAVGVRALLPSAEVENRRILLRLLDDAGKTRVRVSVDQQRLLSPRKALPLHVAVRPLRGYERDARRCVDLLAAAMGAEATMLSPTAAALAAAGKQPGTPGDDIVITADDPAVRPLARALLGYVAEVDQARDGALADLDVEYLHDLRSAIRSTRALLSVAAHLLPGRSAVRVERDLGWLYEQTADLRAIDIASLELAGGGLLTVPRIGTLPPLLDALQRRRRTELRRMRAALRTPRAPAAFTAWRRDLAALLDADVIGPTAAEAAASLPVAAFDSVAAADPVGSDANDYVLRLDALREVLGAYAELHTDAGEIVADVDAVHETLRRRDRMRLVVEQLHATATARAGLPHEGVLAAGAALQAASDRLSELAAETGRAHVALLGKANRRRIGRLVS